MKTEKIEWEDAEDGDIVTLLDRTDPAYLYRDRLIKGSRGWAVGGITVADSGGRWSNTAVELDSIEREIPSQEDAKPEAPTITWETARSRATKEFARVTQKNILHLASLNRALIVRVTPEGKLTLVWQGRSEEVAAVDRRGLPVGHETLDWETVEIKAEPMAPWGQE